MHTSEKNFLEKIADAIPGVKGYRAKESRRDTDKRLRDHLASEIDRQRRAVEAAKRDLLAKGRLDLMVEAERAVGKLQRAADGLRFATYGYAGFFDQVKIREEELDKIYQYDEDLIGVVRGLEGQVSGIGSAADPGQVLRDLEGAADGLLRQIEGRKQIFSTP